MGTTTTSVAPIRLYYLQRIKEAPVPLNGVKPDPKPIKAGKKK